MATTLPEWPLPPRQKLVGDVVDQVGDQAANRDEDGNPKKTQNRGDHGADEKVAHASAQGWRNEEIGAEDQPR